MRGWTYMSTKYSNWRKENSVAVRKGNLTELRLRIAGPGGAQGPAIEDWERIVTALALRLPGEAGSVLHSTGALCRGAKADDAVGAR